MTIVVRSPGMLTTVQDTGRVGCAYLGISPSGAADKLALRIANRIVGNRDDMAALEMTLVGATLEFQAPCTIALAGASMAEGSGLPMYQPVEVQAGFLMTGGAMTSGARTYLAVAGGVDVPRILGSASTHLAGGFGGFQGRALRRGDVLSLGKALANPRAPVADKLIALLDGGGPIRVTEGVQQDWFSDEAIDEFYGSEYGVTEQSNRLGLRLSGAPVRPERALELLTEGVSLGAVQIPPDGQPIVLFVDQQTTGGYPKMANVIAADMHRVGQLRPRDRIRFAKVGFEEARNLLRQQEQLLEDACPA